MSHATTTDVSFPRAMRRAVHTSLAVSVGGTLLVLLVTCVPTVVVTAPPPNARLGHGGERSISVYRGRLYVQKHSFLGIGIPPYRTHRYPSWQTFNWYHRPDRDHSWAGVWAPTVGVDRQHGAMAYWFHTESWMKDYPLWPIVLPLFLACFPVTACGHLLLGSIRRAKTIRRRDRGLCTSCCYPIHGLIEPRCPECGTGFEHPIG